LGQLPHPFSAVRPTSEVVEDVSDAVDEVLNTAFHNVEADGPFRN